MLQELDTDLDLTPEFSHKKSQACSPSLIQLSTFGNINITEDLKHFQYGRFETRLKFIKSD